MTVLTSAAARRFKHLFIVLGLLMYSVTSYAIEPKNSLLLLIDTSDSMGDEIGNGNSDIKMRVAKNSALTAVNQATAQGLVEVAVLAFSGDCANPVPKHLDFTTDPERLSGFIRGLSPGGGTPMAEAVLFANNFMNRRRNSSTSDQMIVLLADGQNDCGDVGKAVAQLSSSGVIFRHETVGFGITPNSTASNDLRAIATATGGSYHHAANAAQLNDVFMEFVDTFTLIDMLGSFGFGAVAPKPKPATTPNTGSTQTKSSSSSLGSLIGRVQQPQKRSNTAQSAKKTKYGAVAIHDDELRKTMRMVWSVSKNHNNEAEARRAALDSCNWPDGGCLILATFTTCIAVAFGETEKRVVYGWGEADDLYHAALRANKECSKLGGLPCVNDVVRGCN